MRRIAALVCALLLVACGDSSPDDAAYVAYFDRLAPEIQNMERNLAALENAGRDLTGEARAANLEVYRDLLRETADAIEAIDAPGEAAEPQRLLVVATRDLADVTDHEVRLARGTAGSLTAAQIAEQGLSRTADWYNACHDLQDRALVLDLDTDLRCVTALGGG